MNYWKSNWSEEFSELRVQYTSDKLDRAVLEKLPDNLD